jgi:flavin reductase (DIM6/NTAB) family NADH-FMN oxidoreductase RutF
MFFDMETLSAQDRYKILTSTVTPRPIAWVTTLSETGVVNAAPYSFFNVMGHVPPTVVIGMLSGSDRFKDTAAVRGQFGIAGQCRGNEHNLRRRSR